MEGIFQGKNLLNKEVGFLQYITKMAISIAITLLLCIVLSSKKDVMGSYVMCTITFALATWFMSFIFFGKSNFTKIIVTAYFVKILIGLVHYLIFIDSSYFSSSGHHMMFDNEEFSVVFNAICNIANDKVQHGLWHTDLLSVFATHPEMMHILSYPFVFFGDNILTFSPFNAWCSSIVCISFICIGQSFLKLTEDKIKFLGYLLAYFPFFLISSYPARDIAGLALMSIGTAMFLLSDSVIYKCVSITAALYLFYLHRTIYPIILLLSVACSPLLGKSKQAFVKNAIFVVVLALVINALAETFLPFVFTENDSSMYDATREMGSSIIIIKVVLFFIGPLWRQIYTAPEYSYAIQETFVIVLMDAAFLALWQCRRNFEISKVNSLMILGCLLLAVGGFNSSAHVPYIAVGVLFLLPFIVDVCSNATMKKKLMSVSIFLVTLNFLSLFLRFGVF